MANVLLIFVLLFLPAFIKAEIETTFNGGEGSFQSPGYPEAYNNSENLTWIINSEEAGQILLNLQMLNIQECENCSCDYILIRDGNLTTDRIIGKYCGVSEEPISVLASGNQLLVQFVSNEEETSVGFSATYMTENYCSQTFYTPNGTIHSPSVSGNYPNNANCIYQISQPPGSKIILKVKKFIIEEPGQSGCSDYVEFRETETSEVIQSYCGEQDGFSMISSNNTFWIKFVSNAHTTGPGFTIDWEIGECGGKYTDTTGLIQSPQHLDLYPFNADCIYEITQPIGKRVWVKFNMFALESPIGVGTCQDYVEIRESATSLPIDTLCGERNAFNIMSNSNSFWIKFKSDLEGSSYGFKAMYEQYDCEEMFTERSGRLTPPTVMGLYASNANCTFKFKRQAGNVVIVTFTTFILEPQSRNSTCLDYVEIEGVQYCGEQDPFQISFESNEGELKFVSDLENSDLGFVAQYDVTNVTITENSGEVHSPGFPVFYPKNTTASYVIRKPFPEAIMLNFTHFNLPDKVNEICTDFLLIREMIAGRLVNLTEICGTLVTPLTIRSEADEIKLDLFTNEHTEFYDGFRMSFAPEVGEPTSTSSTTIRQTRTTPTTVTTESVPGVVAAASALRPEVVAVIIIAFAIVLAFAITIAVKIRSNQTGKMEPRVNNSQEVLSPYSQNNSTLTVNNMTYKSTDDIEHFKFDEDS